MKTNDLNSVLIEGVVQDAKIRPTPKSHVANFKIRTGRSEEEVSIFEIEARGKLALFCNNFEKNQRVRIVGRLKQDQSTLKIVPEHFVLERLG